MERCLIFLSFLAFMESSVIKQYHWVSRSLTWREAQAYCREQYDDMAFVHNEADEIALRRTEGYEFTDGYLGLYRDIHNSTGWKWSGGGYATYTNWSPGPDTDRLNSATITSKGWRKVDGGKTGPFYCLSLPSVEKVSKSWEEAMEHCRENHSSLISLRSDTELLLLLKLMKQQGHHRIWTGLRFLGGRWLWVNGDPLRFQAWTGAERDLQCPPLERCGAVSAEGHWEILDCREKLLFMCN